MKNTPEIPSRYHTRFGTSLDIKKFQVDIETFQQEGRNFMDSFNTLKTTNDVSKKTFDFQNENDALKIAGASIVSNQPPPSVNESRKSHSHSRIQQEPPLDAIFATKVRLDRNVLKASQEELARIKRVVSASLRLPSPVDPKRKVRYL